LLSESRQPQRDSRTRVIGLRIAAMAASSDAEFLALLPQGAASRPARTDRMPSAIRRDRLMPMPATPGSAQHSAFAAISGFQIRAEQRCGSHMARVQMRKIVLFVP
jgi:hypothetical protein